MLWKSPGSTHEPRICIQLTEHPPCLDICHSLIPRNTNHEDPLQLFASIVHVFQLLNHAFTLVTAPYIYKSCAVISHSHVGKAAWISRTPQNLSLHYPYSNILVPWYNLNNAIYAFLWWPRCNMGSRGCTEIENSNFYFQASLLPGTWTIPSLVNAWRMNMLIEVTHHQSSILFYQFEYPLTFVVAVKPPINHFLIPKCVEPRTSDMRLLWCILRRCN